MSDPKPFGEGLAGFLRGNRTGGDVAAPRDAATVILIRPRPDAAGSVFEVFLVRRAREIAFMGGAFVFPGGRVDKTDASIEAAAVREVREETGLTIDAATLVPWARWVTPEVEPKRFDARFFVCVVAPDARCVAEGQEVVEGHWLTPHEALGRHDRCEIVLPPPTLWNLLDLAEFRDTPEVLRAAHARDLTPVAPRVLALENGSIALVLPGDPCYEDPTAPPPPLERQRRFVLEDGRWVARRGGGDVR